MRAKAELAQFASDRGVKIAAWYIEHESEARLDRPELFRLIGDARVGDSLLWNKSTDCRLKLKLAEKQLSVALDLPTS